MAYVNDSPLRDTEAEPYPAKLAFKLPIHNEGGIKRSNSAPNVEIMDKSGDKLNAKESSLLDSPASGGSYKLSSFSWLKDDALLESADSRKVKRPLCCGCFQTLTLLTQTLIYCIFGVVIIMAPGLVSYFFFIKPESKSLYFTLFEPINGNFLGNSSDYSMAIGSYPFFVLSVYLSISWCALWGYRYALIILPEVIVRTVDSILGYQISDTLSEMIQHYVDYARHLRTYLVFVLWSLTNLISWSAIFLRQEDWIDKVYLSLFTVLIASIVWLIEKTFLSAFSVQFHMTAYKDRLNVNRKHIHVLDRLNKARKRSEKTKSSKGNIREKPKNDQFKEEILSKESLDYGQVVIPIVEDSRLRFSLAGKASNVLSYAGNGLKSVVGAAVGLQIGGSNGVMLRTKHDAKLLAKKIWDSISHDGIMTLQDFDPHFATPQESLAAFSLFDKDGNGDISKTELKNTVLETFREHQSLQKSIKQSSQAVDKLDKILKVFACIIIIFASLAIWKVDFTSMLAVLVSVWAGTLFAISGSISILVQNLIFLFVTHPYDVGDRIELEGKVFIVNEFGLNATVLKEVVSGKEVYAPNNKLSTSQVINIRRSGNQSEEIKLHVAPTTTQYKIEELGRLMQSYIQQEECRELVPRLDFRLKVINENRIVITAMLEHKSNWHEASQKDSRRNRFMWKLKEKIEELQIKLVEDGDASKS